MLFSKLKMFDHIKEEYTNAFNYIWRFRITDKKNLVLKEPMEERINIAIRND